MLGNNHLSNIFAEVITIKILFASEKPSEIADCRGEFRGLQAVSLYTSKHDIYKDIAEDVETTFDTSNYELNRPLPK